MHIYLPIAELSAHALHLVLLGGIAGLLSGMFGIGGGFILTPMLIFIGIPPAVAVATGTNMIVASSFSGFLTHLKHRRVDLHMGIFLIIGGIIGSLFGVWAFARLQVVGQIDLMISLLYISLLFAISILMLRESRMHLHARRHGSEHISFNAITLPNWVTRLPLQFFFARSSITHSVFLPVAIGVFTGIIVGLMGIGGGFITIPLMLYVLRMPVNVTVGTSLMQIIVITAIATFLHAITTHAVDIILAALLLIGSVIGAQYGARVGHLVPTHVLKLLLALLLLLVAGRLAYGLLIRPPEIFTLSIAE